MKFDDLKCINNHTRSRDSSVGIVTLAYKLRDPGLKSGQEQRDSSWKCSDQLWGPPSLLLVSRGAMLTTHFHILPRLRIAGTIPPLPQHAFMAWTRTVFAFFLNQHTAVGLKGRDICHRHRIRSGTRLKKKLINAAVKYRIAEDPHRSP